MNKQEYIESNIDKLSEGITAILAINSRKSAIEWKANTCVIEFANSIGYFFKNEIMYIDIARRIIKYLYPENRIYWNLTDKMYLDKYSNSCLPKIIKAINLQKIIGGKK